MSTNKRVVSVRRIAALLVDHDALHRGYGVVRARMTLATHRRPGAPERQRCRSERDSPHPPRSVHLCSGAFDSAALTSEARSNLRTLADSLQAEARTEVMIVGYTNSAGSDDYSQRLPPSLPSLTAAAL